jgi:hypothetical protein
MAYLRIHCDVCGGTWEVYNRDRNDDKARQCPHCFSKIDRQVWQKEVLPAFGAVNDANAELLKEHTGNHRPLFTFDVIADHLYQNRKTGGDTCPLAEHLQEVDDFING